MRKQLGFCSHHGLKEQQGSARRERPVGRVVLRSVFSILLPFFLLSMDAPVSAQESHCDPLIPISKDPDYTIGYRPRDNRCEGVYPDQKSGSSDIFVIGLASMTLGGALDSIDRLYVRWPGAPARDNLRIRALSLRDGLNYRLDSSQPLSRRLFEWPSDIVKQVGLRLDEIGLLGSSKVTIGNNVRRAYIPTLLSDQRGGARLQRLELVLRTNIDLSDIYWSYAPYRPDGRIGEYVVYEKHFRRLYPAGTPIRLGIEMPPGEGLYNGEISTELPDYIRAGTPPATSFVFYYSDRVLGDGD